MNIHTNTQTSSHPEATAAIVKPKIRGFICTTAHPTGCQKHVAEQIRYIQSKPTLLKGPKKVLIIGGSTGYGLSTRIAAAFGARADTLAVSYERPADKGRTASAGWYNTQAFEKIATASGLYAKSINGDAFSDEIKALTIDKLRAEMGPVDLVIYSLASPRRTDPRTQQVYSAVLKPIGQTFTNKTLDTDKKIIQNVSLEAASDEEIDSTIKVMGGQDWSWWIEALEREKLLAPGAKTVAYSYIGPEVTWPVYHNGTIGKAKEDLLQTAHTLNTHLSNVIGGHAWVAVNKAVVTQASSAIPVVPLYISLLFKVMKEHKLHEGCIEQMYRLLADFLYSCKPAALDEQGRIRLDDREMQPQVQQAVKDLWEQVSTENLEEISDFKGYQAEFLKLFGFGLTGIDYEASVPL